jgi:hypothetical protein
MAQKSKNRKSKSVKKGARFSRGEFTLYMLAFALVGAFTLWVSFAAPHKGGGGKPGGGGSGGGTLSLAMVTDNNADGGPNWNDTVTYSISTSATTEPFVSTVCYQNSLLVLSTSAGYFSSYPWQSAKDVPLTTMTWTSGAADCTAKLYMNGSKGSTTTLATLSYHVNP